MAERCDRCVLMTIDPVPLRRGPEPMRTLAQHRRRHGEVLLGIRLVPVTSGEIHVGDPVTASVPEPAAPAPTP